MELGPAWTNLPCTLRISPHLPKSSLVVSLLSQRHLSWLSSQMWVIGLFERSNHHHPTIRPPSSDPKRIQESRIADQLWTPQDDQLLKNLVEMYGSNWHLIADCFNSIRYVASTDIRTNWDCYYRHVAVNSKSQEPESSSSNQMTTRTKRQATLGIDTSGANVDNKKRRRHLVVLDAIRRLAKKKDNVAKMLGGDLSRLLTTII